MYIYMVYAITYVYLFHYTHMTFISFTDHLYLQLDYQRSKPLVSTNSNFLTILSVSPLRN